MSQTPPDLGERTTVFDLGLAREVLRGDRAIVNAGPDAVSVLIVATRRGVFAMQNRCPHLGLPLDAAAVRGRNLRCTFHGHEYEMTSGVCRGGPNPRSRSLRTYSAWIDQGHLFLDLHEKAN